MAAAIFFMVDFSVVEGEHGQGELLIAL